MRVVVLLLPCIMIFCSCAKNYICKCSTPGGVVRAANISGSKRSAQGKCAQLGEAYRAELGGEVSCRIE